MSSPTRTQTPLPTSAIKICGIRQPEHGAAAARMGADYIGMIFAPSRRQVSPQQARAIVIAARNEQHHTAQTIGVFVDATVDEVNRSADRAGLDLVQLSGSETPEMLADLTLPAIKAFRPKPGDDAQSVLADIDRYLHAAVPPVAIQIDGYHPRIHGGTGITTDWALAATLVAKLSIPVMLAGGLRSDNVASAIVGVNPWAVDTSSGVETDEIKDAGKIAQFVENARAAFRAGASNTG